MTGVDLHIHTSASDGKYSPAEIVGMAAKLGLTTIAITDHDTLSGIAEAVTEARKFPGLTLIPGVEISTDVPAGEVHVLGYFMNDDDINLKSTFQRMGNARRERAQKIIKKLDRLGVHIAWPRVEEIAGDGTMGRPHIAEAMLEKGYISNFKEAFTRYIGRGCPAYVEWEKMTPVMAVELILKSGGLPVLAHPLTTTDPEAVTAELKEVGLVGMEVYYDGCTPAETASLEKLAEKNKLIMTGGSDYHGLDDSVETRIGGAPVPVKSVESLLALARERHII